MLNHAKVLTALQSISSQLFLDLSSEFNSAKRAWEQVSTDPTFKKRITEASGPWLLPKWQEELKTVYSYGNFTDPYTVLGIDGSQIYPDKHQGTSCYLVNIGTVLLRYGQDKKAVELDAHPSVYTPQQDEDFGFGTDLVNCKRQELEFVYGTQLMNKELLSMDAPTLFLFDGSLIFWHLEGKEQTIKEHFISRYLLELYKLYKKNVLMAGYISSPKSKELVNLLRMHLSDFNPEEHEGHRAIEHLVDTHVASFFLEEGQRTIVFASQSPIVQMYPDPIKPYFFYLHVGDEIARIEVPKYIAENNEALETISRIILDQVKKGRGYPVACAEAHEQAVVKGPDREFFYHLIQKLGLQGKNRMHSSQKSIKKRGMGI